MNFRDEFEKYNRPPTLKERYRAAVDDLYSEDQPHVQVTSTTSATRGHIQERLSPRTSDFGDHDPSF